MHLGHVLLEPPDHGVTGRALPRLARLLVPSTPTHAAPSLLSPASAGSLVLYPRHRRSGPEVLRGRPRGSRRRAPTERLGLARPDQLGSPPPPSDRRSVLPDMMGTRCPLVNAWKWWGSDARRPGRHAMDLRRGGRARAAPLGRRQPKRPAPGILRVARPWVRRRCAMSSRAAMQGRLLVEEFAEGEPIAERCHLPLECGDAEVAGGMDRWHRLGADLACLATLPVGTPPRGGLAITHGDRGLRGVAYPWGQST